MIGIVTYSQDAPPVCLWPWLENSLGLVSLRNMLTLLAVELVAIWPSLQELHLGFEPGVKNPPDKEELDSTLGKLIRFSESVGWKDLANQATRLRRRAEAGESGEPMVALARDLQEAFTDKSCDIHLVVIGETETELYKNATAHLCGAELHGDLSISAEELNLAGKALACGLSTASVSHAMRSIEASLHVSARVLGISFPGGIELQDWANLTEKIAAEISKQEKVPRSTQKAQQLKKLSELALPADCFRLVWRNHVAHAREKYEEPEARKALTHVAGYLKKLSDAL
jgi:hypothetical protein